MPQLKLKAKYWHTVGKSNWIFGIKKDYKVTISLQMHSKIPIQRHVKGIECPFDRNPIYEATKTAKSQFH
jgi:hypothetical protein